MGKSENTKADTPDRIRHFGVWIKNTPTVHINRENYAPIDKNSSTWSPRIGVLRKSFYKTVEQRKKIYDDEECKIYSDEWCAKHQENCLKNYDLNMAFFQSIRQEDFDKALLKLINSTPKIREVFDLNEYKDKSGIYIMVLGKFKQVYIGQSTNIKKRIMQHWSKKKQFDRLIFGRIENSVLSIDSFGALDTTQIFALEASWSDLDKKERLVAGKVPNDFKLNRVGTGSIYNLSDMLEVIANSNKRDLLN